MMGLEPTTFCMASRRSSQLSYIRRVAGVYHPTRQASEVITVDDGLLRVMASPGCARSRTRIATRVAAASSICRCT